MAKSKKKTEWLHCNVCGRSTSHLCVFRHKNKIFEEDILGNAGEKIATIDGCDSWEMLECQGCQTVCLRSEEYFSESYEWWDPEGSLNRKYYPARNIGSRAKPNWFDTFINLKGVHGHFILTAYQQVYELIDGKQYLAAMLTARALLETLAIKHGDGDLRTFSLKLEALRKKDLLRKKQAEFLESTVYDAGSASMHRGYNPSKVAVTHVLDAIESLIHAIYVEPLASKQIKLEKPKKKKPKGK